MVSNKNKMSESDNIFLVIRADIAGVGDKVTSSRNDIINAVTPIGVNVQSVQTSVTALSGKVDTQTTAINGLNTQFTSVQSKLDLILKILQPLKPLAV
ncbi:p10-3 [Spodoptera litura granulovirus]|uniref:P10-3 n=1 Tax=Spodoptera litura granulovirus TaxID=359919 RepID=A5IZR5_9BBAC|nr:p10-3 [Spodoptera litura granulovirus]ABQ52006.1 p10-3 [Spodoptera litura granulovirus]